MASAAHRARAEGELGIMKQLNQQHLQEQEKWQKRDNLQYFMQTVHNNAQGDVHPVHQAVMLQALDMALPSNFLSGAPAGTSAGGASAPMLHPSLMMAPPAQMYTHIGDKGVCDHCTCNTFCLISMLTCMPFTVAMMSQLTMMSSEKKMTMSKRILKAGRRQSAHRSWVHRHQDLLIRSAGGQWLGNYCCRNYRRSTTCHHLKNLVLILEIA